MNNQEIARTIIRRLLARFGNNGYSYWDGNTIKAKLVDIIVEAEPLIRADAYKEIGERGEELCPHGTKSPDTSHAYRRECDKCWQELVGILKIGKPPIEESKK